MLPAQLPSSATLVLSPVLATGPGIEKVLDKEVKIGENCHGFQTFYFKEGEAFLQWNGTAKLTTEQTDRQTDGCGAAPAEGARVEPWQLSPLGPREVPGRPVGKLVCWTRLTLVSHTAGGRLAK